MRGAQDKHMHCGYVPQCDLSVISSTRNRGGGGLMVNNSKRGTQRMYRWIRFEWLPTLVFGLVLALVLLPPAATSSWQDLWDVRVIPSALDVPTTSFINDNKHRLVRSPLRSLRGGSAEGGHEQLRIVNPMTPVAPAAIALQEELGRVTKEWVKDRGRRGGTEPARDLQDDIDDVIAQWTKTAIATPRTVLQSNRYSTAVRTDTSSPLLPSHSTPFRSSLQTSPTSLSRAGGRWREDSDAMSSPSVASSAEERTSLSSSAGGSLKQVAARSESGGGGEVGGGEDDEEEEMESLSSHGSPSQTSKQKPETSDQRIHTKEKMDESESSEGGGGGGGESER